MTFTSTAKASPGTPATPWPRPCWPHGRHQITTSIKLGRPRGFTAAWAEDPGGLVQIEHPFPEPMLLATTVELYDGLVARGIPGQGRLATDRPTPPVTTPSTCTSMCWSSAPAGRPGRRAHRRPRRRPGGAGRRTVRGGRRAAGRHRPDRRAPAAEWVAATVAELASYPRRTAPAAHHGLRPLRRRIRARRSSGAPTTSAPTRRQGSPGNGSGGIRAKQIVIATGAHERPVVFTDNDRPGIMLAARRPHLPAPLRREGRPHGGRVHHQRQRLPRRLRPARRRRPDRRDRRRPPAGPPSLAG